MIGHAQIEAALADVYDPCSVQANAAMSVVDMGLITGIRIEPPGSVRVRLRVTSPWCTMIGSLMQGIEERVRRVDGVTAVTVEIDRESTWSEADLTDEGRRVLSGARERSRAAFPVRRRQWQERIAILSED